MIGSSMDALYRLSLFVGAVVSLGAGYETPNFVVNAPTAEFAKQVGDAAEYYRRELSLEWTGQEMPNWWQKCPIHVTVGAMGAGGATTFNFERGEVFGWRMNIQGTEERILDSVLPHEINHTVFACYFRRPLPRWADEGAASLIEHDSERMRLRKLHDQVMNTTRKIPLKRLLELKDYPSDQHQVLTMYAEGHSLADYLIGKSDKATFLRFLNDAHRQGWDKALRVHYKYSSIGALEQEWDKWVLAGSPAPVTPEGQLLADRDEGTVIRGQSPEPSIRLGEPTIEAPKSKSSLAKLSRSRLAQPVAAKAGSRVAANRRSRAELPQQTLRFEHVR
jgi:hypothetical protein